MGPEHRVVVLLPDSVRNYMTKFLSDEWMAENGFIDTTTKQQQEAEKKQWKDATVGDLKLPDAITVSASTTCSAALQILNKGGFDQVPVVDEKKRMVGLVTVGSLLSKVTAGRVKGSDPVTEAMFHFDTKRDFVEVTPETKLADLNSFFETNSAAFVTVRENGVPVVKKVITKVDMLTYLLHSQQ